jgi:predicted porin
MKKSLIALAVLAASGAAMAQSSVTIFGIVDAAYTKGSGSVSDKTQLTNSGYNSSRLGFRGVEDLGGGMKAAFHIEGALANDNGNSSGLTFQRRSTVSLESGMGEIRLGRDYTPHFWNQTVYDAFGTNGIGTSRTLSGFAGAGINGSTSVGGSTAVRSDNTIGYFSPSMGGVKVQLQNYMGETASTAAKVGSGSAIRVTFDQGKFSAAYASGTTTKAAGVDVKSTNFGASYDLGVAKIMALSTTDAETGKADVKGSNIGALVPMAGGTVRIAASSSKQAAMETKQTAIGFVKPLSKRTDIYATYARVTNAGGAKVALGGSETAANASSNGYDIGVKHSF